MVFSSCGDCEEINSDSIVMAADETKSWRNRILQDLRHRNKQQCEQFAPLIISHNRLLETSESYRIRSEQLDFEVKLLKTENEEMRNNSCVTGSVGGSERGERTVALEQKVYKLQDELTELHRKRGENAQTLIDLNNTLKEKEKQAAASETRIKELEARERDLVERCGVVEQQLNDESTAKQCLMDELQALQMAYASLENSLRRLQQDNADLVARWMALKSEAANQMNAENDEFRKRQQEIIKKKIEAAVEATVTPNETSRNSLCEGPVMCFTVCVPSVALQKFEGHDGEVNAVRWGPSGTLFATGGSDRKLKLWEVRGGRCEVKGVLLGSNAGVMSIDFDTEETVALAASSDFACRIWTCSDLRLRHTLTGHSGKALAAKFLSDSSRVITGSHDRTLKMWDLRTIACMRTIFAGSSCNDIAVLDGSHIVSGHFDKTVRFWDIRADTSKAFKEISLDGRVTALDLTADKTMLLGCARDDTISLIDVKSTAKIASLSADGFRTAMDWSRAVFSPDGSYVAAGSLDGAVYVWEVATHKLHSTLKEHKEGVLACAWNPNGRSLLSSDKHRAVVYWSDI